MSSSALLPSPLWRHPEFRRGLDDMTGTALGIAAWGLLTGIAMAKSDLAMPLALLMSLIVFAGSAQLAALPLLASGAPLWVIWATALCGNLRFVIFSAGWRRYYGALPRRQRLRMSYFMADLNYALLLKRFPEPAPLSQSVPYFWGGVALNYPAWHVPSLIGLFVGDRIPTAWGLGFAGTPTSTLSAGASRVTTAFAPTTEPAPIVTGPRILAPAPTATPSPSVGCLFPEARVRPPSVTPW